MYPNIPLNDFRAVAFGSCVVVAALRAVGITFSGTKQITLSALALIQGTIGHGAGHFQYSLVVASPYDFRIVLSDRSRREWSVFSDLAKRLLCSNCTPRQRQALRLELDADGHDLVI